MRANYKNFNISIHEDYQEGIPMIMVIPQDFSRAVLNVMNNACYSVWKKSQDAGADYLPAIEVSVKSDGQELKVVMKDNGLGMSDEVKQHIYENFYTTKPAGQGTGLGMSITHDIIVNRHHGRIDIDSVEGEYASFTFTIPVKK
jgi:signal transduction histidine kinase